MADDIHLSQPPRDGGWMAAALILARVPLFAGLLMLTPFLAHSDQRQVLENLMGHTTAEVVQRLGPPGERRIAIDGERLFYDRLDAGRFGGRAGSDARDTSGNTGLSLRDYEFRCRTEIVIRNGRMQAFNRTGNDCH
jgi:hypothetical protein